LSPIPLSKTVTRVAYASKIATRSLQKNTKTKKRTPPTPPGHSSLTSCPTNKNARPVRGRLQGLLKSLPVPVSFIAPAGVPNHRETNAAYILKIEETNPIHVVSVASIWVSFFLEFLLVDMVQPFAVQQIRGAMRQHTCRSGKLSVLEQESCTLGKRAKCANFPCRREDETNYTPHACII